MTRKALIALLMLAVLAMGTVSCDKLSDKLAVGGGISGRVLNADGSPHGLVAVVLIDTKNGAEAQRQTAEDTGTFFFQKVKAGTYEIKVQGMSGSDIPCEKTEVKLAMGRTLQQDVKLLPMDQAPPAQP
jgi:hypothetical protein